MFTRLLLFVFLTIGHFPDCRPTADVDPRLSIRLNEVHIENGKFNSKTTFDFIEIYTSEANVQANNITAVIYSGSSMTVLFACPCDKAVFNDQGIGMCDCGRYGYIFKTLEFVGAIGLHDAPASSFNEGDDAKKASQIGLLDAILWQTYGEVLTNPLQDLFAPGQNYHYQPPASAGAVYSINRCFGNPLSTGKLQASYSTSVTATPGDPNICDQPPVIVNQIHINSNFVQLLTNDDFPLDSVTLALVTDTLSVAWSYDLSGKLAETNTGVFTVGPVGSSLLVKNLNLPTSGPVAIVVYYQQTITAGSAAPTTGILSSVVYSDAGGPTSGPLQSFGSTTYAIDATGKCSLSNCGTSMQYTFPMLSSTSSCSKPCTP